MDIGRYRKVILDASALLTLISGEKGAEKVQEVLPKAIMSSVNVSEVAKFLIEKRSVSKEYVKSLIERLIDEVIDFNAEQAYNSAELVLKGKEFGLSLGDRVCISLAITRGFPVYTADKIWTKLKIADLNIELVR